jgi:hypothetical protein
MVDALWSASQTSGVAISPLSLALTGCTLGATHAATTCTGGLFPNGQTSTGYISNFPNVNTSNNGVGKIDYHISDKNTLNGEVLIGNYVGDGEDHPFINKIFTDSFIIKTYTASGTWDYTPNSTFVNEVRFGYNRMDFITGTDDAGVKIPGLNSGATVAGLPDINVSGFNQLGTWHNRPQSIAPNPYYDFQDSISYLTGKHTLKFGFEYAHIEADSYIPDYGRGRIDFTGGNASGTSTPLEDLFAGQPGAGKILIGNPTRRMTWSNTAGFVQDDWRLSSKFTLNLGLRYEFKSPIKEASNLWANFDPTSPTGLVQQGQPGHNSMWKSDPKDFSPRIGFAYDVKGDGKTVVRGGFSVMYSSFSAVMWMNQNQFQNSSSVSLAANPTGADIYVGGVKIFSGAANGIQVKAASQTPTNAQWNSVIFPPVAPGNNITCSDTSQCNLMAVDPNLLTPYVTNFNVGIQHAFGSNLSLEVGYVGNHGSRLTGFADINAKAVGGGNRTYSTQFPWFKFINEMTNDVRSNYNSLQTTLTKRMSHGLSFIAGYTFAHGLDNGSLNRFALLPQNANNPGAEYGNSDFDVRHRLTFTTTYNIPGIKGFGQILEGWQVNGIVTLQSAQPWTVNDYGNDFSKTGDSADRWDFFGNPSDFKGTQFTIPYCTSGGPKGCSQVANQTGARTFFADSQTAAMWSKCTTAQAANPQSQLGGGCFVSGNSVMLGPADGTFGTMGRNIFRDSGFKNLDFSLFKNFKFRERYGVQFRAEMFNVFNHPLFANPYGASAGSSGGQNDPSTPSGFGGTSGTPDVNAGNPIVGSGAARDVQLGLKLTF